MGRMYSFAKSSKILAYIFQAKINSIFYFTYRNNDYLYSFPKSLSKVNIELLGNTERSRCITAITY